MTIAVDFDGTIVENRYPEIGREMPFAVQTLKMLQREGHQLILWTVRNGRTLENAINWCEQRGLEFYSVNKNFDEEDHNPEGHHSVKLRADMFIDDRNVGGMLDWGTIYRIIHEHKTIEQLMQEKFAEPKVKKGWWPF